MKDTDKIGQTIQNLDYDIKAEAVIADMLEDGAEAEDFVVVPIGMFRRRYSRDIAYTRPLKLNNGSELTGVHINRDAIYDTLPEGFFHQNTEHSSDSGEISKESKKLKEEEKAARNFFLPFENEIFTQRINLELEERKILNHFRENLSDDFSSGFWRLDQSLDGRYLSRMIKFLHISHKIAGNTELTEKCLEAILEEHVSVNVIRKRFPVKVNHKDVGKKHNLLLGSASLGVDFVFGNEFISMTNTMQFTIGPLKNSNITDYLKNGHISKFLKIFFEYFVPAEFVVSTNVLVANENQHFTLKSHGEGVVLGYETAI